MRIVCLPRGTLVNKWRCVSMAICIVERKQPYQLFFSRRSVWMCFTVYSEISKIPNICGNQESSNASFYPSELRSTMSATCVTQLTRPSHCNNLNSPCSLCHIPEQTPEVKPGEELGNTLRMNNNQSDANCINIQNGNHHTESASLRSISSEDVSTATVEDRCCAGKRTSSTGGSMRKPSKQRLQMLQVGS